MHPRLVFTNRVFPFALYLPTAQMKPYQMMPIVDCGEPLVPIPLDVFAVETPHPYEKLGAPYGGKSPYYLRQGVLHSLVAAQHELQQMRPGWQLQVFDAYRPIAVQQFMVDHTFAELVGQQEVSAANLSPDQRQAILEQVYQFWAVPSHAAATPPPHSTGAAIDLTLVDETGCSVPMGSPIDEISARSHPNYFADASQQGSTEGDRQAAALYHQHRQLLFNLMNSAGFRQHPNEWWHFSLGDQMWAWQINREEPDTMLVAYYGAI